MDSCHGSQWGTKSKGSPDAQCKGGEEDSHIHVYPRSSALYQNPSRERIAQQGESVLEWSKEGLC